MSSFSTSSIAIRTRMLDTTDLVSSSSPTSSLDTAPDEDNVVSEAHDGTMWFPELQSLCTTMLNMDMVTLEDRFAAVTDSRRSFDSFFDRVQTWLMVADLSIWFTDVQEALEQICRWIKANTLAYTQYADSTHKQPGPPDISEAQTRYMQICASEECSGLPLAYEYEGIYDIETLLQDVLLCDNLVRYVRGLGGPARMLPMHAIVAVAMNDHIFKQSLQQGRLTFVQQHNLILYHGDIWPKHMSAVHLEYDCLNRYKYSEQAGMANILRTALLPIFTARLDMSIVSARPSITVPTVMVGSGVCILLFFWDDMAFATSRDLEDMVQTGACQRFDSDHGLHNEYRIMDPSLLLNWSVREAGPSSGIGYQLHRRLITHHAEHERKHVRLVDDATFSDWFGNEWF